MRKKVLVTRKLHPSIMQILKKRFDITTHPQNTPIPRKTLISKIKAAQGLICFPYDTIDKTVIDAAKNLKVISTYSVGYDHIDITYAKKRKIAIGYTPNVLTHATADLTMGLILDIMRKITESDYIIRSGKWSHIYGPHEHTGVDLQQKTLGILGMGRIGAAVAKRATAFGLKIIYHNSNPPSYKKKKKSQNGPKYVSFDTLISKSDILTLHIPQTKQTQEIININTLKKMKRTAFLINTARGKIINQNDLVHGLQQKIIAGAALDVFEKEPISKNNPLTKLDNVILVPHIGSSTNETRQKMAQLAVKNLILGMNNKKPIYAL